MGTSEGLATMAEEEMTAPKKYSEDAETAMKDAKTAYNANDVDGLNEARILAEAAYANARSRAKLANSYADMAFEKTSDALAITGGAEKTDEVISCC